MGVLVLRMVYGANMKLYKAVILPSSNFATPLQGDTLFGQLCWSIRYCFGEERLQKLLQNYEQEPFLVVSDAFTHSFFPKPTMPSKLLNEHLKDKKENEKKHWLRFMELQQGRFEKALKHEEANCLDIHHNITRNALNYLTFKTDDTGSFAPFSESESTLSKKDIYFLLSPRFSKKELFTSLNMLATSGYGKNCSIGKGRFVIEHLEEVNYLDDTKLSHKAKTFMTLSALAPKGIDCEAFFYKPFTKFGKHSVEHLHNNPFKKPMLFANTGAVVHFQNVQERYFLGKGLYNFSAHKNSVHQGYSILLPIKELNNEAL